MTPEQIKARLQPFQDAIKRAESHYHKELHKVQLEVNERYKGRSVKLLKGEIGKVQKGLINQDGDIILQIELPEINSLWWLEDVEFLET